MEYNLENCSHPRLPLVIGKVFENDATDKRLPYEEIIGSLKHCMNYSRPGIDQAIGVFSRKMNNFSLEHWNAAKRTFAYLDGTNNEDL
jgi:hypothetical protein